MPMKCGRGRAGFAWLQPGDRAPASGEAQNHANAVWAEPGPIRIESAIWALLECAYHRYKASFCRALKTHTSRLNDGSLTTL